MMDSAGFEKAINRAKRDYRALICEACGEETLSAPGFSVCSNCECIISADRISLQGSAPSLLAALDKIRACIGSSDFDGAVAVYDALISERKSPQLIYAKGVMQIEHSNYETSKISYDGKGFMEENIERRNKSLALISDAKKQLAKSIYMLKNTVRQEGSDNTKLLYNLLLGEIKMGNMRGAKECLDIVTAKGDDSMVQYCKLLIYQADGNYASVGKIAKLMMAMPNPPVTVMFYAAFARLKSGNFSGSTFTDLAGLVPQKKIDAIMSSLSSF